MHHLFNNFSHYEFSVFTRLFISECNGVRFYLMGEKKPFSLLRGFYFESFSTDQRMCFTYVLFYFEGFRTEVLLCNVVYRNRRENNFSVLGLELFSVRVRCCAVTVTGL